MNCKLRNCLTRLRTHSKLGNGISRNLSQTKTTAEEHAKEKKESLKTVLPKPYLPDENSDTYYPNWFDVYHKLIRNPYLGATKDWSKTWPAKAPFDPYKVPIDIRMGMPQNRVVKPDKYANLELVKIENFLHLTPATIKEHCKNLKQYCTEWPKGLTTDAKCDNIYPTEYHTVDYVTAGQTQRNHKARIVTLKICLHNLTLNRHAREKLIKLAGSRYNIKNDTLTIIGDKCPMKKQNTDYLKYLLTVLYFESWKHEDWEIPENRSEDDGVYYWETGSARKNLITMLEKTIKESKTVDENMIESTPKLKNYKDVVVKLKSTYINPESTETEKHTASELYKDGVKKLLGLNV